MTDAELPEAFLRKRTEGFAQSRSLLLKRLRTHTSLCYGSVPLEESLGYQSKFRPQHNYSFELAGLQHCLKPVAISIPKMLFSLDCSCKSAGKSTHVYMSQFAESMDAKKFTLFSLTKSAVQHISARNNAVTLIDCFSTVTSLSLQPYPGL